MVDILYNFGSQTIRNDPISQELWQVLRAAGEAAGVDQVVINSGGQEAAGEGGNRTGSTRHDHGNAGDVQLVIGGRLLDFTNPQDQAIFQNFAATARANGATGLGAGVNYMGPNVMHVGFGTPAIWGGTGANADAPPAWLQTAFNTPAGAAPQAYAGQPQSGGAATGASAALASQGGSYAIRSGDTLSAIAERVLGDPNRWQEIAALNPGINPNNLQIGQSITLPGAPAGAPLPRGNPQRTGGQPTTGQMAPKGGGSSASVVPGSDTLQDFANPEVTIRARLGKAVENFVQLRAANIPIGQAAVAAVRQAAGGTQTMAARPGDGPKAAEAAVRAQESAPLPRSNPSRLPPNQPITNIDNLAAGAWPTPTPMLPPPPRPPIANTSPPSVNTPISTVNSPTGAAGARAGVAKPNTSKGPGRNQQPSPLPPAPSPTTDMGAFTNLSDAELAKYAEIHGLTSPNGPAMEQFSLNQAQQQTVNRQAQMPTVQGLPPVSSVTTLPKPVLLPPGGKPPSQALYDDFIAPQQARERLNAGIPEDPTPTPGITQNAFDQRFNPPAPAPNVSSKVATPGSAFAAFADPVPVNTGKTGGSATSPPKVVVLQEPKPTSSASKPAATTSKPAASTKPAASKPSVSTKK